MKIASLRKRLCKLKEQVEMLATETTQQILDLRANIAVIADRIVNDDDMDVEVIPPIEKSYKLTRKDNIKTCKTRQPTKEDKEDSEEEFDDYFGDETLLTDEQRLLEKRLTKRKELEEFEKKEEQKKHADGKNAPPTEIIVPDAELRAKLIACEEIAKKTVIAQQQQTPAKDKRPEKNDPPIVTNLSMFKPADQQRILHYIFNHATDVVKASSAGNSTMSEADTNALVKQKADEILEKAMNSKDYMEQVSRKAFLAPLV